MKDLTWGLRRGQSRDLGFKPKSFSYDSDSRFLAVAGGQSVKIWDLDAGLDSFSLSDNSDEVWSVAFSPDGKMMTYGCDDGSFTLWDAETRKLVSTPITRLPNKVKTWT